MVISTGFSNIGAYFQAYGVMDFLLPFVLVFTITYAVLLKTRILGDKKNFNVVVALVLGLLFVVPHITGSYPLGYDPVDIMNQTLPSISLVAIGAIMVLLLLGVFGKRFSQTFSPVIAAVALGFVIYIFGASFNLWQGPYDVFYWWTTEVTELLIIILIFALVVWFITKEPSTGSVGGGLKKGWEWLSNIIEDAGGKK